MNEWGQVSTLDNDNNRGAKSLFVGSGQRRKTVIINNF